MSLIKLNWHPKPRDLRMFGAVFAAGFFVIGLAKYLWPFEWFISNDETLGLWLIGIGAFVGILGLTGTRIALPFYWAWLGIAYVLGNIMSRVVMTLIYLLLFTPMRVLGNLIGRDKLQLKRPKTESYWQDISLPKDAEAYERQF